MDIAKSRNFLLRENIEDNLYLNLQPKQAIDKAAIDYNHALKSGDSNKSNRILNDLKDFLESSDYKWQQDPKAVDILGDLLENNQLDEMAKITGDLKTAIEKVIADNKELNGLPLKKAIRANAEVQTALDGEDLYDNQLNKFIALAKGERELGQRGAKPGDKELKVTTINTDLEPEGDDEEIIDTWNTSDEEDTDETGPSSGDIDNSIASDIPSAAGDVDAANSYKNIIVKKVNKIESLPRGERENSIDMKALKQFIKKPEVAKALTVATIRDLVSSIIG